MFQNKKLKRNATYAIAEVALRFAILIALCPPLVYTVSVFGPLLSVLFRFSFCVKKFAFFYPHFYISKSALTRQSHILDKSVLKRIFCQAVQLYFEILLLSFIRKILEQNFYQYIQ